MALPRCSAFLATSLDGYIARPDGAIDWLAAAELPGEDFGYADFARSVDTLLLGRGTYDVVQGFGAWPYEGKRVAVLTHRPIAPAHGEVAVSGEIRSVVARLGQEGARHVYVDGGQVVRAALAAGLLDTLTLSIVPRVLGRGIRLFGDDGDERGLALAESRTYPNGLVQLRYRTR